MAQFSVHDAKSNLSNLIATAMAGGDVGIARGAVPAVRLVPVIPPGKRQFGILAGKISIDERFNDLLPEEELSGWNV